MNQDNQTPEILNRSKFNESLEKFIQMVTDNTDQTMSFQEGFLETEEGYKRLIYDKAGLNRASLKNETEDTIKEKYIRAIDIDGNNLLDWRDKDTLKSLMEKPKSVELVYRIYTENSAKDEELFNEAIKLWGHRFPIISFTFFLKDMNSYVPVRPNAFKKRLACLGADLKCMNKCTWDNYQKFINILKEVQRLLNERDRFSLKAELIDAHSFVWILWMLQKAEIKEDMAKYKNSYNMLFYGVPGAGKSYKVNEIIGTDDPDFSRTERVVFHPEYTYSDFIGQILPKITEKGGLTYVFIPGPFTRILKGANADPDHNYFLVIEEMNRGNAPTIFGDVFQLLDRENGESIYSVTNADIAGVVYDDENRQVQIPANLKILATMNTSDQNVFTLDTAFQRRWEMELIPNNIGTAAHAKKKIGKSRITWEEFATAVNDYILSANDGMLSSEDKRLGAYFVNEDELNAERFSQKVLKYLWDDAFKMGRTLVFKDEFRSLEDVVRRYNEADNSDEDSLEAIFKPEVYLRMTSRSADNDHQREASKAEATENHTADN